jgi:hypothetical protein
MVWTTSSIAGMMRMMRLRSAVWMRQVRLRARLCLRPSLPLCLGLGMRLLFCSSTRLGLGFGLSLGDGPSVVVWFCMGMSGFYSGCMRMGMCMAFDGRFSSVCLWVWLSRRLVSMGLGVRKSVSTSIRVCLLLGPSTSLCRGIRRHLRLRDSLGAALLHGPGLRQRNEVVLHLCPRHIVGMVLGNGNNGRR